MKTVTLLRKQLNLAHDWFEGTMADVTQEQADIQPAGTAHSIASRYAHLVVGEDILINSVVRGGAPMYAGEYAGKTGISEPRLDSPLEWARSVRVDMDSARRYAQAVYANSDAYLSTLQEADLERTVDLSEMNMGQWTLDAFLLGLVIGHVRDIMGEVSALKGTQGLQGYPF